MWRVQNYLSPLFCCFCSSPLGWSGGGGGGVFSSTYTSVCFCFLFLGAVAPRFSAIVKSDIFIFCRGGAVACVRFVKLYCLQFCEVVAGFLGVVMGWASVAL